MSEITGAIAPTAAQVQIETAITTALVEAGWTFQSFAQRRTDPPGGHIRVSRIEFVPVADTRIVVDVWTSDAAVMVAAGVRGLEDDNVNRAREILDPFPFVRLWTIGGVLAVYASAPTNAVFGQAVLAQLILAVQFAAFELRKQIDGIECAPLEKLFGHRFAVVPSADAVEPT